jgi:serine/threonine protein kinase
VSTHVCPTCRRSFDEPGFCPFDRSQLIVPVPHDQPTLMSSAMPVAQPKTDIELSPPYRNDPHKTDLEPRRTTPGPGPAPQSPAPQAPIIGTQELTNARQRAAPPASEPSKIRALSASEDPQQALEAYAAGKKNEYDKLVGQTLDGRYFVEKKIGEGGMGVVFSARHSVIERPLAIKVLKREVMRDTATIRRFVQEAKAASRIGHPNIVDVTDFGTTPDGMTYSVMEFVTGRTLGAVLRKDAPFPMIRAIKIASQIARALGAAHDKGIIHRDLKPENVFLIDRDGRTDFVKIVDFGIAKVVPLSGPDPNQPRLTRAGSVFGTPEYMAPEQAAGRSDTDGRVDIYALGVILYEMICGRVPHRGDSMVRTLAMQMLDPVTPPSQVRPDLAISPELEALIMKALAKKRDQRFQTMGELLAGLEGLQTKIGQSLTGSPVYALQPLPPGADPSTVPAPGHVPAPMPPQDSVPLPMQQPSSSLSSSPIASRSKSPTNQTRRAAGEPEFVTRDKPVTFEHVFTGEAVRPERRSWPLLLLGALIVGAAIGVVALMFRSCSEATQVAERRDAAGPMPAADATLVAQLTDASVTADADIPPSPPDATDIVLVEPDAGTRVVFRPQLRDAGRAIIPVTPNGRGTIMIQVLTKPEGAILYVNRSYRGVGGTNLEEALGTKMDVTCSMAGYQPGTVHLVFDGATEVVLCVLKRIKRCVDGIKNPFDDCEPDPPAPSDPPDIKRDTPLQRP